MPNITIYSPNGSKYVVSDRLAEKYRKKGYTTEPPKPKATAQPTPSRQQPAKAQQAQQTAGQGGRSELRNVFGEENMAALQFGNRVPASRQPGSGVLKPETTRERFDRILNEQRQFGTRAARRMQGRPTDAADYPYVERGGKKYRKMTGNRFAVGRDDVFVPDEQAQEVIDAVNEEYDERVEKTRKSRLAQARERLHANNELIEELRKKRDAHAANVGGSTHFQFSSPGVSPMSTYGGDSAEQHEASSYSSAISQLERENEMLNAVIERKGMLGGMGDALFSADTALFGLPELSESLALRRIKDKIDRGEPLTEGERALFEAGSHKAAGESLYGDMLSNGYRWGQIAGYSVPFAAEMLLTGGGLTALRVGSRLATKGAAKIAAKGLAGNIGRGLVKGLGVTADEIGQSAILANTLGAGRTWADIERRNAGTPMGYDEQGNPVFEGGKSRARSIWEGQGAATLERYSEKLGNHMHLIGDAAKWGGKKIVGKRGAQWLSGKVDDLRGSRVGKMYSRMSNSDVAQAAKWLGKRMNFNGYIPEVMEEEANIVMNSILVGDNQLSDLADKETQLDIWGGMAVTSGFLGSANLAMGGLYSAANRAHRRNVRNNLRQADSAAGFRLTQERWQPLRERIDDTSIENTPGLLAEIINSGEYTEQEARAVLNYVQRLNQYRGMNLAENAAANGGEVSPVDGEAYAHRLSGAEAAPEQRAQIRARSEAAEARLKAAFRLADDMSVEDWLKQYGETRGEQVQSLFADETSPQDNPDVKMVLDYINARESYEGVLEGVEDATEAAVQRSNMNVADNTAPDGNIHFGTTRSGKQVYVVSQQQDGVQTVVVRDAATGELQQLPAAEVQMNGAVMNGEEFRASEEERIRREMSSEVEESIIGAPTFDEGDVYEAMTEDGQRYTITVGARNEDGTVQVQSSLDAEPVNVNPEQVGGAILADMDRARASEDEAEQGEIDEQSEMPSADVDAAQGDVPVYQQNDMVEARMPGGTVRGEIFEVSDEAGMPVYSVLWESPVQGVMVGRYSGDELAALQPAAERETGIELVMPTDEEVAAVTAERLRREEAEAHATSETLTDEEIEVLLAKMEAAATPSPELPLTPENWNAEFGEDGSVETPVGRVKMGENQISKLFEKDRSKQFGMIRPTLEAPHVIIEVSSAQEGEAVERGTSYLFVRAFTNKAGEKVYFFKSVTVRKGGMEVSVSSHYDRKKRIKEELKNGKLLYRFDGGAQTEHLPADASVTTSPEPMQGSSSASKGTPQSVSVQGNEQKSLQPIPTRTTKKGTEVLYHEVPVARTLEELYDGTLTQPEVDAFVAANVEESRKQAEKTESTPPKMGTDLAAYKQAKAEWQGKVDEARRKADYWLEVQAEVQKITGRQNESASRSIESASRSIESASRFTEMPTSMSEAQDGAEYAAMAFAGKMALRITPESFRGETGLGSAEQRQLTGVIATAQNGGVTIEQAAEWLYAAQENDGVSFYADETEARDAIIEVLSQGNPKGYVARSRKEAAKRDSQAEAADKEAWAQQHFHMSFEEYQTMEEQALPAIIEQYRGFDEATYYANLANDYEQQNERRNETRQNSATESAGIGRSGELLQGEQPASTGGTRHIGDGQQGRAAASDVQGGVSAEDARGASGEGKLDNVRRLETRREQIAEAPTIGEQIQAAEAEVNTNPTEAQKEAGNYKKGHVQIGTFNVTIEQPKGSVRSGVDADGKKWETEMQNTYGYIRGTEGVDGDHIDVFLANDMDAWNGEGVFVVDQYNEDGTFDEHKVMLGFNSIEEAQTAYLNNYEIGWAENHKIVITGTNVADFEKWINSSHRKTKAFAEYKSVKTTEGQSVSAERRNLVEAPVKAEAPTISQESEQVSDQDNTPYNAEEARRQPLRERAKEWEAKTGVKVHLIEDLSEVQNKAARAALEAGEEITGWYGRRTGEVYIYLPNVQNESDIDATYVHEVVAHKGMRSLLSAEGYDKLCDRVWNAMSEDARREYTNYPGVENIADEAKRRRAAADEYIAHLAEKVNLTDAEQTVWQQVVQFFREALEALGIDVKVSDAQLSELIRASYAKMAQERKTGAAASQETETDAGEQDSFRFIGEKGAANSFYDAYAKDASSTAGNADYNIANEALMAERGSEAFARATEHTIDTLKAAGVEVVEATDAMVEEVLGLAEMHKQKKAPETASVQDEHQPTVVSSADGAKVLKDLDSAITEYENKSGQSKTFLGDIAQVLGATKHGSNSQYATFEAVNGKVFTIRLANHNAKVSNFDNHGENEGISIVVTAQDNNGINNDGNAHVVEFFYDAIKLRKADGKPLVEILKSIKQALYSGEYKDTTGLAQAEEVNIPEFMQVYHGSGAKFDKFDHSFMGTGEGAQAFGWGTYVTEVEGIGRSYANSANDNIFKTGFGDFYLKKIRDGMADGKSFEDVKQNLLEYHAHVYEQTGGNKDMFGGFISDYETLRSLKEDDLPKRNLYTVEIPDDNGLNYLNWYNGITDEQKKMITDAAQKEGVEFDFYGDKMNANEYFAKMGKGIEGHQLYGMLKRVLGSDKAVSEFLNRIGYVGIKYPTESLSGGNKDGKSNYVIFNEADAQITDRVEFLRTSDGVVYGWAVDGKIYLTKEGMNPNTPAHEYTHLWAHMIEKTDSTLWGRIVDGLRGCATWNDVLNDKAYEGIWGDDSRMASEVLSRLTGAENYRREMARAQRDIADAKSVFEKAEKVSVWENVKKVLRLFLDKVKSLIQKGEPIRGVESDVPAWMEFVDMALGDLYGGVNPGEVEARNVSKRMDYTPEQRRASLASETADVAQEDQIFIYDGLESANSEIEKQKPFHEMIDDLYGNKDADKSKYARTYFHVADTPDFMSGIGLNGAEFTIPFKAISSHIGKDSDHYLDADIWHNLPEALHNPFLVTKYGKDGRFRIYTTLMHNGKYVAVGVDVKRINQGRNKPIIEINSIKTVFAKTGKIGENETVVCYDERITPEQEALLGGRNFRQYPTIQELSEREGTDNSSPEQGGEEISFRLSTGDKYLDDKIGAALYNINKEAKRYRDLKSEFYRNGMTERVLKGLQDIDELDASLMFDEYSGRIFIDINDHYYYSEEEISDDISNSERELNYAERKLDDEDSTEEEREDAEYDVEYYPEHIKALQESIDFMSRLDYLKRHPKKVFDRFKQRVFELYELKERVLSSLISNGGERDALHYFPKGDVRALYKLGDYSFHGSDISEDITDDELDSAIPLGEISADKSFNGISVAESEKVIRQYLADADMKLHTTDVGGNYSYPDVEEDVNFRVFGGNSGYVGYSKSKRAVAAEERGLRNASQMNAEFAKEVNSIIEERTGKPSKLTLKAIKAALPDIKADEWHHTSKFGNKTNYYSAEGVASHFAKDSAAEARESAAREDAKRRDAYAAAVRERIPTMKVETALGERDAFITSEGYTVEVPNNVTYNPGSARLYAVGELMGAAPYVVDSTSDWVLGNRDAFDNAVREYMRAVEKAMAEVDAEEEVSFSKKGVSDAELEAIAKEEAAIIEDAKKNGTYLKAPNGKPTKLTPKQWVQVRTKAFKKWFGDWEKAARIKKLRASGDAVITGEEIAPSDDLKEYKKNALEYGKTLRGEYVNADTGQTISIGKSGVKEVLNHDYKNAEQLQSIAAIPQIIENAIYIDSAENEDVSKNKDVSHYHYYICGLKIGDVDYTVRAVVAEQSNGERYYDHKLTQIEKGTLLDSLSGITTPGFNQETSPVSMGKDMRLLSLLQTNASKVVDGNGEPMVATHGTPEFFNTFDMGTQGAHDAGWLGTGFYFYTKNREYSNAYVRGSGRVMDVFLNIRNPYYATSYEMERLAEADSRDASEEFTQELLDEGYDGVYYDGDLNGETVAFHPNQIKSAEENVGLFSEEDEDIRFSSKREKSEAENIEAVNARFNAELQQQIDGTLPSGHIYQLGMPNNILKACGFPNLPIEMSSTNLAEHARKTHHPFELGDVKGLVESLQHPIAVFAYGDKEKSQNVIVEIQKDGRNFLVGVHFNQSRRGVVVSDIRGIFPKDNAEWLNWISKGKSIYLNKEKIQDLIDKQRKNLAEVEYLDLDDVANVIENFENPQVTGVKNDEEEVLFSSKHEEAREDWTTRTANMQAAVDHYERMTASTGKKWFVTALAKTLSLNAGTRRAARNDLAEAYFDYTRSLEQLIKGIEKAYGKKVKGFENVWWAMNRKSSMDAREMDRVRFKYVDPLSDALGNLLRHASKLRGEKMTDTDVETYLMALHGLERNLHMAKRYAREAMIKEATNGLALKERDAAINNVDATIAARESNGEEWWSEYRKDYSGFTEMFGEGLTNPSIEELEARAQEFIDDFRDAVRYSDLSALEMRVKDLNVYSLRKSYECGLISRELYDRTRSMYQLYVPLRGFANNVADDVYNYIGRSAPDAYAASVLKEAGGRTSRAANVFGTMTAMAMNAITNGHKNQVAQSLMALALNYPTPLLSVGKIYYSVDPSGDVSMVTADGRLQGVTDAETRAQIISDFEEEMKAKMKTGEVFTLKSRLRDGLPLRMQKWQEREHAVRVLINGEENWVYVNGNPKAAQAMNGLLNGDEKLGSVYQFERKAMRFVAQAQTSLSPQFIISNFERDLSTVTQSAFTKFGAEFAAEVAKNYTKLFPLVDKKNGSKMGIFGLMGRMRKEKLDMQNETERLFYEFSKYGGITGISNMYNIEDYQRQIEKYANRIVNPATSAGKKAVEGIAMSVEYLNSCIENTGRFAIYMACRQSGMSIEESIYEAKEGSINFNRKGSGALGNAMMRQHILYSNVAFQALRKEGTLWESNHLRYLASRGLFIALGCGLPIALCAMMGGDDDEYYGLSEWQRYNYINVWCGPGKGFLKFSLPQEIRGLYALGHIGYDLAKGRITPERAMQNAAIQLNNYLPTSIVSGANRTNPDDSIWKNVVKAFTPSVLEPFADAFVWNEDFLGNPISNQTEFNRNLPEHMRAGYNTPDWVVSLGRDMHGLTGARNAERNWFDAVFMNPSDAFYIGMNYAGGLGTFVRKLGYGLNWAWDAARGNDTSEYEIKELPLVSAIWSPSGDDRSTQRVVNEKFGVYEAEYEALKAERNAIRKEWERGRMSSTEVMQYYNDMMDNGSGYRFRLMDRASKAINKLKKERGMIDRKAHPKEWREINQKLYEIKQEIVKRNEAKEKERQE